MNNTRLFFITFMLTITSCAHYYKDSEKWSARNLPLISGKFAKDFKVKMDHCPFSQDCENYVKQTAIPMMMPIKEEGESEIDILKVEFEHSTVGGKCLTGYPGLVILFVLTAGIIPVFMSDEIEGKITYRDNKTQKIHEIDIDVEYTTGMGWLYWIRAWTTDRWKWKREVPQRYKQDIRHYFHEYVRWKIGEDKK